MFDMEALLGFVDAAEGLNISFPPPADPSLFVMGFSCTDDMVIRRRPQKGWNESDLDVAYEKKSSHSVGYERES